MDPRVLQEIDEGPETVRLVLPVGYPAQLIFEWRDDDGNLVDLTGCSNWAATIYRTPAAPTGIDFDPDASQQASSVIVLNLTADQVAAAAKYGSTAIWKHSVVVDGTPTPLMAGPVIIRR